MGKMKRPEDFESRGNEEWERFDPAVLKQVEKIAVDVDKAESKAHAEAVTTELNKMLDGEGLIGSSVRLSSDLPIIVEEIISASGVEKRPVFDPIILGKQYFEGSFSGCGLVEFDDIEGQFLTYDVTTLTDRGFLLVRSVVDMARMEVNRDILEVSDEEDSDVMVAGAFNILESVGDEDYADAVQALRATFEDFDQPAIVRVKQIGQYSAAILASPEHIKHTARMTALNMILKYSYDNELEYLVGGYREYDELDDDFNSNLRVSGPMSPERAIITGVKYLTDFEVTYLSEDGLNVKENDGLQPAYIVKFAGSDTEYDYPMRFLSRFEEYQFHQDDWFDDTDYKSLHAGLPPTCGEQSRDFWEKVKSGEISMGKAALRRFRVED